MLPDYEKRINEEKDLKQRITALENALASKANTRLIMNCDLNELKSQGSGLYVAGPTVRNSPYNYTDAHYYIIQICLNEYSVQILTPLNGLKTIWIRQGRPNNNWNDWTQLHSY